MKILQIIEITSFYLIFQSINCSASPTKPIPEFIYKGGSFQTAHHCGDKAEGRLPSFQLKSSLLTADDLKNIDIKTLEMRNDAPAIHVQDGNNQIKIPLAKTFLQLYVTKSQAAYFECGGAKYWIFNAFAVGNLSTPIAQVGVSENDDALLNYVNSVFNPEDAAYLIQPQQVASARAQTASAGQTSARVATSEASTPTTLVAVQTPPEVKQEVTFTKSAAPVPVAATESVNLATIDKMAPWHGKTSNSMAWTKTAVETINSHLSQLSEAQDINTFCPKYHDADKTHQIICWVRIFGAIMQPESGYRPAVKMRENNGQYSVGLLAMSAAQCPNAPSISALQDPLKNIACGVTYMANMIDSGRYGKYLSGSGNRLGAAANWSSLQPWHKVYVRAAGRTVPVGFKKDIIKASIHYADVSA